jgi:O-antigen/teichoic acid export membrane protein
MSYLVTYRFTLANADQKGFIYSTISTISTIVNYALQIASFYIFFKLGPNDLFLVYLLIPLGVAIIQTVVSSVLIDKWYPILKEKDVEKLSKEENKKIAQNVGALSAHRLASVVVYQLNSILMSAIIGGVTLGVFALYNTITTTVIGFVGVISASAVASFGNLVAEKDKNIQEQRFTLYRFINYVVGAFCFVSLLVLLTPFVRDIWALFTKDAITSGTVANPIFSTNFIMQQAIIFLMCAIFYFSIQNGVINNFEIASGLFKKTIWVSIVQSVVSIGVASGLGFLFYYFFGAAWGLVGILMGNIASWLVSYIARPIIIYKHGFEKPVKPFFINSLKYLGVLLLSSAITLGISYGLDQVVTNFNYATIVNFSIKIVLCIFIPNAFTFIFFGRSQHFKDTLLLFKRIRPGKKQNGK